MPVAAVAEARARALGFLSQVLGGDAVAAEYLLLQLLARCVASGSRAMGGLRFLRLGGTFAAVRQW